ncbi:MAG: sulfite exporter TauE/SafE family protein [Bacteroidetes bacterium]|nr:MAG: sulfite exporter TauE/SafE family protein [Bacteroidota bacterium]RLD79616.1 MAG: sulfite exporter TauE/SafE family protein [Bacteroidota bacterium]
MEYISALVLGLLGSFHCIGMCGPIAIALPLKTNTWTERIASSFIYNIGRTITYGILGFIFGLIGKGISLGGLQQWVSIIIGVLMILSVLFPVLFRKVNLEKSTYQMISRLKGKFGKMFSIRSYSSLFTIGILNGFLPCGLVYIAIAGAIVSGEVKDGILYMIIFGLGTIPVMMALSILGNVISVKFRNKIRVIIPIFIVIIGILFILRGMNLGIKYVSPKFDKEEPIEMECCH